MDFDFCQVLYTAIDEIYNFRLGFERAIYIQKKFNQPRSKLLTASLIIWRYLAKGDSGCNFWGWGRVRKRAKHSDAVMTGILVTKFKMGQIVVEDLEQMAAGTGVWSIAAFPYVLHLLDGAGGYRVNLAFIATS